MVLWTVCHATHSLGESHTDGWRAGTRGHWDGWKIIPVTQYSDPRCPPLEIADGPVGNSLTLKQHIVIKLRIKTTT